MLLRRRRPGGRRSVPWSPSAYAAAALYLLFLLASLVQAPGTVTTDTRSELVVRPGGFLAGAFRLWDGQVDFGQFQNQAYGYLFPQGPFFLAAHLLGVPAWVGERVWSALVLVIACEGARRVGRALGLPASAALLAGLAFALSPRLLGTVGVISAESLPGAVMPWVLLPVLGLAAGRLSWTRAALLSGAATVFMGGVNAVEDAACLLLPLVCVIWAWWVRQVPGRFVLGWLAALGVATAWWTLPLVLLSRFGPPFYEFVESAVNTTAPIGWSQAVRGDSTWTAYFQTGGAAWWPGAFMLATDGALVVVAAVVAGLGLAGLARLRTFRAPLAVAAGLGLAVIVSGHGGIGGVPFSPVELRLLDGPLQIFRNVHKFDPAVRLPLALGFGQLAALVVAHLGRARPRLLEPARLVVPLTMGALVLALGAPYELNQVRTPGWQQLPRAWVQARDYLAAHEGQSTTLVLPGSGFALQPWGWTLDEPLQALGGVRYVVRNQVPLIPGESIRYLDALDRLATTGRATADLAQQLARAGIGHVLVRRDLAPPSSAQPPEPSDVSAEAGGLEPVARYGGAYNGGSQIEIYRVPSDLGPVRFTEDSEVRSFRGGPEAVLALQRLGLLPAGAAAVQVGRTVGAALATDTPQRRERAFGALHGQSAAMEAGEPYRLQRSAHDYPAGTVAGQAVVRYAGLRSLTASSAQAYADTSGEVVPSAGPAAAVDGRLGSRWVSDPGRDPVGQWLRLGFAGPRPVRSVRILPVIDDPAMATITRLEVDAGRQRRVVDVPSQTGPVVVRLDGTAVGSVRVRVAGARSRTAAAPVALTEVAVDGWRPTRSVVVPGAVDPGVGFVMSSEPGVGACVPRPGPADCDVARIRAPEESRGLHRTLDVGTSGPVLLHGLAVARSTPAAARLLDPLGNRQRVVASSVYGDDPLVSARFAYDGDPSTEWRSSDQDYAPTLKFHWPTRQRITGLRVRPDSAGDAVPAAVIVRAGGTTQRLPLSSSVPARMVPVTARTVRLTFVKGASSARVAVAEVGLDGVRTTVPFAPAARTGMPCGFGPNIHLGSAVVPTRVTGTMGDVVRGTPLDLSVCSADAPGRTAAPTELAAGTTTLAAPPTSQFFVTDLAGSPTQAPAPAAGRTLGAMQGSEVDSRVHLSAGPAGVVWLPQNFNTGWHAAYAGHTLRPQRVDGWQQGWRVPAGGGGALRIWFGPERLYVVVIGVGLGLALLLLLLAGGLLVSRRGARRRAAAYVVRDRSWAGRRPVRLPALVALAVAAFALLGPVAAVAGLAGRTAGPRRALLALGALAVGGSGIIDANAGGGLHVAAAAAAAAGAGLLLGAALYVPGEGDRDGR